MYKRQKQDLLTGIIIIAADLFVLYCVGAFSVPSAMQDTGLGNYSANLNAFWNPLGKGRILPTRLFREGQDVSKRQYIDSTVIMSLGHQRRQVLPILSRGHWQGKNNSDSVWKIRWYKQRILTGCMIVF